MRMVSASTRSGAISAVMLVAACLAAGSFAARLNARFYERTQPFYDSMSYHGQVHGVMTKARADGILPALEQACRSSTVCLPLAMAAMAGPFVEPSRIVGIAIQTIELLAFTGTLFFYLRRIRGLDASTALLAVVPFLIWRCLWESNGGLSDFRMDLSLCLLYATTVLWYLIAASTGKTVHFVALGVAAAAACLFRATAPVYLVVALAPVAVADLVPSATRRARLTGLAVAAATAIAGCLWFFVLNYDALHYYYVVWNTDANAKLPLRQALAHGSFGLRHIGVPSAVLALAFPLVLGIDRWIRRWPRGEPAEDGAPGRMLPDWRMAWIGLAPLVFLVARGAGLNPFVSMPAAFGLTMLLLLPIAGEVTHRPSRPALAVIALLAVGCAATAAARGWRGHHGGAIDSMAAHLATLDCMVEDAARLGRSTIRYGTTHCFYLNRESLFNVALFDHAEARWRGDAPVIRGMRLRPDATFDVAAEADWNRVPGTSQEAKIAHMIATAERAIDYLVIPDEETSGFVQERLPFNVINRHAVELRRRLLEGGRWEPVSDDIRNGENEVVRVYRNTATAEPSKKDKDSPANSTSATITGLMSGS